MIFVYEPTGRRLASKDDLVKARRTGQTIMHRDDETHIVTHGTNHSEAWKAVTR